ncbi:MAG: NUDIX domain-containing protein [Mollicutes bacterium]|nr:NUDIX domain-containing protein [Mollicutes bacterium]
MKPGIGVGVMIIKNNKILLGLRNPSKKKANSELPGEGTWTMPGGKVEYMETLKNAAIRELKEETNLEATKLNVFCISDDMTDTAHYVTVGFMVTEYKGKLKTMEPETILEWKWFDLNELPKNIYKPSEQCIQKYLKKTIYL